MAGESQSSKWVDRILKIGPLLTGIKWVFDNWTVVLGGSGMIYAASITGWLQEWGPVAWGGIGILAAAAIAIASALLQLLRANLTLRQDQTRYYQLLEKAPQNYNLKSTLHHNEVLRISDMFSPVSQIIEGK